MCNKILNSSCVLIIVYFCCCFQQLKLIASSQKAYPSITDRYQAKATSMNTVNESFYYRDSHNIVAMIHVVQAIFPIITCALFIGFFAYYWVIIKSSLDEDDDDDPNQKEWSTIAAYYLVSLYFTLFAFGLDCAAVHYRRIGTEFITGDEDIKNFVITPMIYDGLAGIFIVALPVISIEYIQEKLPHWFYMIDHTKWQLGCLGLAGLAPVLCIASHTHFIVIAWITGPGYAYGIGVFYAIIFFVYFFTFKFLYYICARYGCGRCCAECDDEFSYAALFLPLFLGILLTGFFVMIACFVVLIPITESIEDASRQVSVIYQGIIFVLTLLLAYLVIKPIQKEK